MITRTRPAAAADIADVAPVGTSPAARRRAAAHRAWRHGAGGATILLVALVCVIAGGIPGGPRIAMPWTHPISLHIQLRDSRALQPHADVEVAGVKVGEVTSVTDVKGGALVTVEITDPSAAGLHRDATALLRPHGLFGPKYIDLQPGSAGEMIGNGDTITVDHTVQPVDLDGVLQSLQAPEQANLRTTLVELGAAMSGQGATDNRLLVNAAALTSALQPAAMTLSAHSGQVNSFIVNNEAVQSVVQGVPLDQLVANNDAVLQQLADNSAHLQSLLVHANAALAQLNTSLNGESGNLAAIISTLPGVLTALNSFNAQVALLGNNLIGNDHSVANDPSVVNGIIAAIENPKSAFSSYDCASQANPCPPGQRRYYLRVQVFNLGGTGSTSGSFPICDLPLLTQPGTPPVACPGASTTSAPAGAAPAGGADLTAYSSMVSG